MSLLLLLLLILLYLDSRRHDLNFPLASRSTSSLERRRLLPTFRPYNDLCRSKLLLSSIMYNRSQCSQSIPSSNTIGSTIEVLGPSCRYNGWKGSSKMSLGWFREMLALSFLVAFVPQQPAVIVIVVVVVGNVRADALVVASI